MSVKLASQQKRTCIIFPKEDLAFTSKGLNRIQTMMHSIGHEVDLPERVTQQGDLLKRIESLQDRLLPRSESSKHKVEAPKKYDVIYLGGHGTPHAVNFNAGSDARAILHSRSPALKKIGGLLDVGGVIVLTSCSTAKVNYLFNAYEGLHYKETIAQSLSLSTGRPVYAPKHAIYINEVEYHAEHQEVFFGHPSGKYKNHVFLDISPDGISSTFISCIGCSELMEKVLATENASNISTDALIRGIRIAYGSLGYESLRVIFQEIFNRFPLSSANERWKRNEVLERARVVIEVTSHVTSVKERYTLLSVLPVARKLKRLSEVDIDTFITDIEKGFFNEALVIRSVHEDMKALTAFLLKPSLNQTEQHMASGMLDCMRMYGYILPHDTFIKILKHHLRLANEKPLESLIEYAAAIKCNEPGKVFLNESSIIQILKKAHVHSWIELTDSLSKFVKSSSDKNLFSSCVSEIVRLDQPDTLSLLFALLKSEDIDGKFVESLLRQSKSHHVLNLLDGHIPSDVTIGFDLLRSCVIHSIEYTNIPLLLAQIPFLKYQEVRSTDQSETRNLIYKILYFLSQHDYEDKKYCSMSRVVYNLIEWLDVLDDDFVIRVFNQLSRRQLTKIFIEPAKQGSYDLLYILYDDKGRYLSEDKALLLLSYGVTKVTPPNEVASRNVLSMISVFIRKAFMKKKATPAVIFELIDDVIELGKCHSDFSKLRAITELEPRLVTARAFNSIMNTQRVERWHESLFYEVLRVAASKPMIGALVIDFLGKATNKHYWSAYKYIIAALNSFHFEAAAEQRIQGYLAFQFNHLVNIFMRSKNPLVDFRDKVQVLEGLLQHATESKTNYIINKIDLGSLLQVARVFSSETLARSIVDSLVSLDEDPTKEQIVEIYKLIDTFENMDVEKLEVISFAQGASIDSIPLALLTYNFMLEKAPERDLRLYRQYLLDYDDERVSGPLELISRKIKD